MQRVEYLCVIIPVVLGRHIPGFAMNQVEIVLETVINGTQKTGGTNEKKLFVRFRGILAERASLIGTAFVYVIFDRYNFMFLHNRKTSAVPSFDHELDIFTSLPSLIFSRLISN